MYFHFTLEYFQRCLELSTQTQTTIKSTAEALSHNLAAIALQVFVVISNNAPCSFAAFSSYPSK
jgi:hypothetical protein